MTILDCRVNCFVGIALGSVRVKKVEDRGVAKACGPIHRVRSTPTHIVIVQKTHNVEVSKTRCEIHHSGRAFSTDVTQKTNDVDMIVFCRV